jgi:cyclic AMP-dependent transcription factor ATF-4
MRRDRAQICVPRFNHRPSSSSTAYGKETRSLATPFCFQKRRPAHHQSPLDDYPLPASSSASSIGGGNSERKKELNRIAATKYREKKRRERELLVIEQKELEQRNVELRSSVKELRTEMSYVRKMLKEMEARSGQQIF